MRDLLKSAFKGMVVATCLFLIMGALVALFAALPFWAIPIAGIGICGGANALTDYLIRKRAA